MLTIPARIPVVDALPVVAQPAAADPTAFFTYDVSVGGLGFRLASDENNPLVYETAPYIRQQVDQAAEPGEQTLTGWWPKSQSSFHGGAGLLNLERVDLPPANTHIRFDTSLGVDVWTPGKVTRLPDTRLFNFGFTSTCLVTSTVAGVDYAVFGGPGGLFQAAWLSGPDANPTVTGIDLTGAAFGGAANCNVTSLATDGVHYFALIQLTVAGSAGAKTVIASGTVDSAAAPLVQYYTGLVGGAAQRTNQLTNPNFESNTTAGWSAVGTGASIATTGSFFRSGTRSMSVTGGASGGLAQSALSSAAPGLPYTFSTWINIPAVGTTASALLTFYDSLGSPLAVSPGSSIPTTSGWIRQSVTMVAPANTATVLALVTTNTASGVFYLDDLLLEQSAGMGDYFDGSTAGTALFSYNWTGATNLSTSQQKTVTATNVPGVLGWSKFRLVAGLGQSVYQLDTPLTGGGSLPVARYTHPTSSWTWAAVADAPTGILIAGSSGNRSNVLSFTLDTSGGTPFLSGGASVAEMPPGELITSMNAALGSFIVFGTNKGMRVGTFDTYTGALKYGPIDVETTQPVLSMVGRGRFMYGTYTNQQADGKTGLVRLDLSIVTDQAGRLGWAPDLRPPSTAPTGLGNVTGVGVLPASGRIVFVTPEGIHVEGNGPGTDGSAWIRTSRIRFNTSEPKLFKFGRVRGDLATSEIATTAITPDGVYPLVKLGFTIFDPDEFKLPAGAREWLQMKFELIGASATLTSYGVKALPGTRKQRMIQVTCAAADRETDRHGRKHVDIGSARSRVEALYALDAANDVVLFEEFTMTGSTRRSCVLEKVQFKETGRPTNTSDFGGKVVITLRTVDA